MSRNWVLFAHRENTLSQPTSNIPVRPQAGLDISLNMATKEVYHYLDVFAQ